MSTIDEASAPRAGGLRDGAAGGDAGGRHASRKSATARCAASSISCTQYPTTVPFLVLVLGIAAFTIPCPLHRRRIHFVAAAKFFSAFNLSLILQQVTIIAILGIAQTLVILTAGIDLSVGVIMILCSVVMGRTCVVYGVPLSIAFPLGLLVGLACGAINGLIVTLLRLPPFIVTLGTWSIFGALNIFYSRSETIRQQDIEAVAPFLQWTGTIIKPYDFLLNTLGLEMPWLKGSVLTYGSILMVLLAAVVWYVLNRTAFGRHVYATGDDPDAARLAGINTDRTLVAVYALAGLICAIAAWVLIGRIGGVSPQAGQTANLDFDHRRGDRRHQPVRRPRLDRRHTDRRADRRRVPQRPGAVGPRRAVAGVHRRRADHRRRDARPVDQEGVGMSAT